MSIENEGVHPLNDETDWKLNPEDEKNFLNKLVLPYLVYPPNIYPKYEKNTLKIYEKKIRHKLSILFKLYFESM